MNFHLKFSPENRLRFASSIIDFSTRSSFDQSFDHNFAEISKQVTVFVQPYFNLVSVVSAIKRIKGRLLAVSNRVDREKENKEKSIGSTQLNACCITALFM